jgi:hypothetical protein
MTSRTPITSEYDSDSNRPSYSRFFKWGVLALLLAIVIVLLVSIGNLYEENMAGEILIVQAPFSGELAVYTDPGRKWQGWGKCTHYKRSNQFEFFRAHDGGTGNSIKIRFNDGGHAQMSGSARYDLPLDKPHLLDIHQTFGSPEAVHAALIKTVMEKSVFMTGPIISSKESYAEKRSDMLNLIEDQAVNGVFQTNPVTKEVEDYTGEKKWVTAVEPKMKDGVVLRQEKSPLVRFEVKLYNMTINDIGYEPIVEKQIASQQEATMAIQTAMAQSKKAEQDKLTEKALGEAKAIKAKWEQEVLKATAVTEAQQKKEVAETEGSQRLAVAKLDRAAADEEKNRQILLGEGEATRKKLVMQADGALEIKTKALIAIAHEWAPAVANYKGNLTPQVVMGSGGTPGTAGANTVPGFIDLLTAKAARDLSLDMSLPAPPK